LHGDWTLIGGFRRAVEGRVRFVECTYPRTLTWTLEEYATGVERALGRAGVSRGWLLAESFGSQVAWPLAGGGGFEADGVILAGGFGRHPLQVCVRASRWIGGNLPLKWITHALFGYARVARLRHRHKPEVVTAINDFLERRTELDRQAAVHRLRLIAMNNPAALARGLQVPVYALSGFFDPVVPWLPARKWLRNNCPSLREYRVVSGDHPVLNTASRTAAEQVLRWMNP